MTPMQIRDRLREEFGEQHVSFCVEVTSFPSYCDDDPSFVIVDMKLYHPKTSFIPCASLEEGISALKVRLNEKVPEMELTV